MVGGRVDKWVVDMAHGRTGAGRWADGQRMVQGHGRMKEGHRSFEWWVWVMLGRHLLL